MELGKQNKSFYYQLSSDEFCEEIITGKDIIRCNKRILELYKYEEHRNIVEGIGFDYEDLKEAQASTVIQRPSAIIEEGGLVIKKLIPKIGPNCYIGKSVEVGRGVRIKNSIILGGCEIGVNF